MGFTNPLFLLGLAFIAVPIYLHLVFKRQPILKLFPSLMLIQKSIDYIARKQKLKNIILLILRILILLLLTFIFAKPYIGSSASAKKSAGAQSAFVILIDNSMSMGAVYQGISVFNAAKSSAIEILSSMRPDDKGNLGTAGSPGKMLFSQLTWDKDALTRAINELEISSGGTDLPSALVSALKLLQPLPKQYKKTIYLITDMTASSWKRLLDIYDLERIDPDIDLALVPIGNADIPNMAVTDIKAPDTMLSEGTSAKIKVTVKNGSKRPEKNTLSLYVNGHKKADIPFEIEADSEKEIQTELRFSEPGNIQITASLPDDLLPLDNRRHLALKIYETCKVLIIKPSSAKSLSNYTGDIFLKFALNPLSKSSGNIFAVESRFPEELGNIDLKKYKAVALLDTDYLSPAFIKSLSEFLLKGGNIFTFMGSRCKPEWHNEELHDNLGGGYILPGRVFNRVGNSVSRSVTYRLTDLDFSHPALKLFEKDDGRALARGAAYEFFQVQPNPAAIVLAKMSHGFPGVVEEKRGKGLSILFSFPAETGWTELPLRPIWVPFIHSIFSYAVTSGDLLLADPKPGYAISLSAHCNQGDKFSLKTPDNKIINLEHEKLSDDLAQLYITETDKTGFYELLQNEKRLSVFAVNPEPSESDLERIRIKDIPRFLVFNTESASQSRKDAQKIRQGWDLTPLCMLLLILLVAAESWFANLPADKRF